MVTSASISTTRFTVLGAARSGLAAARLLHAGGAAVLVSEQASEERMAAVAAELRQEGIPCEFGGHSVRAFEAGCFVVSPGIPSDAPALVRAASLGIEVISEIELGARLCPAPIIAVTGTNGKTTTTTLIGELFMDAGADTIVAGNIGTAFCDALRERPAPQIAVLEVSSFQLDHCSTLHPVVAVLTTITPDHLYRYHGSMVEYTDAKRRVFRNQNASDAVIYNADTPSTVDAVADAPSQRLGFSVTRTLERGGWREGDALVISLGGGVETLCRIGDLRIGGAHNHRNILSAAIAARLRGVPLDSIRRTLATFRGVEHRLEAVRTLDGVDWINDSKATNVDSVVTALESIERPIILIAGGRDKEAPYNPLLVLVRERVRAAVLIGEAAPIIEAALGGVTRTVRAADMADAVIIARSLAQCGDVVLLSPACSSFDMFADFEERGRVFKSLVAALPEGGIG